MEFTRTVKTDGPPKGPITVEGQDFYFVAHMGTKAMRHMADMGRRETAIFDSFRALAIDEDTFDRLMDLDLDEIEVWSMFEKITDLYKVPSGESSASPTPSSDDEASSSTTSDGSTDSTSTSSSTAMSTPSPSFT
jgi:hypothetical protein